jgi:biopolymer transport protein ExbD
MVSKVADSDKKGQLISDLYEKLLEKAETAKDQAQNLETIDGMGFKGQIMLQCDRSLPFSLIREVMYTAGQAQFGEFKFVVVKTSG